MNKLHLLKKLQSRNELELDTLKLLVLLLATSRNDGSGFITRHTISRALGCSFVATKLERTISQLHHIGIISYKINKLTSIDFSIHPIKGKGRSHDKRKKSPVG